jgi:hypothetical protein
MASERDYGKIFQDLTHISNPTKRDFDRIAKYRIAIEMIEQMDRFE